MSSEERNAAARARLAPLAPGERPRAVTVAAIVAFLLAAGNAVAALFADDPTDQEITFTVLQVAILVIAGVGMVKARYWAVLGFQALLALQILALASAVALGDNALGQVVFGVIAIALATLFWFLIKAMARLQMPERPGRSEE